MSENFQITNAELVAILKAILSFETMGKERLVILTDSITGCKWTKSGLQNNYLVHLIREQIERMYDKDFIIQWIPSHVGIHGNEEADDYANRGCYLDVTSPLKITFSDGQLVIKKQMFSEWQEKYQHESQLKGRKHFKIQNTVRNKPWFQGYNLNGTEIKVLTRLRTNHGLCGMKKYMFKLEENSLCEVCQTDNDLEHIMLKCQKHDAIRNNYQIIRNCRELAELLKEIETDKYKLIIEFYKAAGLEF